MATNTQKVIIGFLILVVLTTSIYILLPDKVRIDVGVTKTTFKVFENDVWVLSGIEYTKLFEGSSLMKANLRTINKTIDGTKVFITRTSNFKDGIQAIDTYEFDGGEENVELFPISHQIRILNAKGKILQYEVNNLLYTGVTEKGVLSPQSFGHQMEVEWEDKNYYSQIYKYAGKDVGRLIIKYKLDSSDYSVNVRLFDPSGLPADSTPILNSTDPLTNDTVQNLTLYYYEGTGNKTIINWLRNGTSITAINMPFEGINETSNNNEWDYSGYVNNGSDAGGVAWNATGGYDGKGAYMFDGINDRISIGNKSTLKSLCLGGCTVGAWINYKGPQGTFDTDGTIISRWDYGNGQNNQFYYLAVTTPATPQLKFIIYQNGSEPGSGASKSCSVSSPVSSIQPSAWLHVMGRYNFTHVAIFINGTQQGTTDCSTFASLSSDQWMAGNVSTFIGAKIYTSAAAPIAFFNGTIDEVIAFNMSLSARRIFAIWQNRTDLILGDDTVKNENWSAQVTPNNNSIDGKMLESNQLSIISTCRCPSPARNITIFAEEMCSFQTNCNLQGSNVTIINTGNMTINAEFNVSRMIFGNGITVILQSLARLNIFK